MIIFILLALTSCTKNIASYKEKGIKAASIISSGTLNELKNILKHEAHPQKLRNECLLEADRKNEFLWVEALINLGADKEARDCKQATPSLEQLQNSLLDRKIIMH